MGMLDEAAQSPPDVLARELPSNAALLTVDILLRRAARSHAARPAVIDEDRTLSYAELDAETDAFACALLALGVRKGDRLGLLLLNQWQFFVAYFAVARLGAVVVPINHRLVPSEIDYQLSRASCSVLIYASDFEEVVEVLDTSRFVRIPAGGELSAAARGSLEELVGRYRGQQPRPSWSVLAEDPNGVWFTSGTTGLPKGATTTHASALWAANALALSVGLSERHRLLGTAPLFHRGPMEGLHLAGFLVGAPHVLLRRFDAGDMLRMIEKHRITHAFIVPTMTSLVLGRPDRADYDLSSIEGWFSASARLPGIYRDRLVAETSLRPDRVFDAYGITESLLITMLHPLDAGLRPESVGCPVPGVLLQIVDAERKEVTAGTIGEISVAAPSIASGYLGMPEEWAAVTFAQDGRTWYCSGDLGFVDEEGFLHLVDRAKDMVVTGGENVYSAEVERVLSDVPGVADVAVIGMPHERWGEAVTAVVVREPGPVVTEEELLAYCEHRLAAYKRPRTTVFVDVLPRNSFGKIQKQRIRELLGGERTREKG
ncbi:class I adenylate-forming enzyme family protein [Pseudonocardia xishanensis]|uniref:AMP-binding protein n=1 Tax=Pseudonocardia xishanensis TaxID=630995 RepID=A0ABP8RIG1_9PSEU